MVAVRPRRWDVGRWAALAMATAIALSACGQARLAAPPEPEFTRGQRAEPTVPAPTATLAPEVVDPASAPGDDDVSVDVSDMVIVDDAGNAAPNLSGWAKVDAELERRLVPANLAASVAVMVDGQLVHQSAFGRRVAGTDEQVETTDRFRIASISKVVTAITVLRLVEDGRLTLDEPVGPVVAAHLGLDLYDPDVNSITVRELLSHTAGFPKHEGTFFSNGATSCVDAATQGLTGSVSSGGGFNYSNMSYCTLGVLIEAVTGKTYERVVYEQLLTPLGIDGMRMTSTYELGPDEVSHNPSPNRNFMETLGAAGSWNATPSDIVAILDSVDPATDGWKALSPESIEMIRYRIPSAQPPSGYGLGLINYGGDAYGHTGTIEHTHAMVLVQPDGVTWSITVSGDYPSSTSSLRSIMRNALAAGFGS